MAEALTNTAGRRCAPAPTKIFASVWVVSMRLERISFLRFLVQRPAATSAPHRLMTASADRQASSGSSPAPGCQATSSFEAASRRTRRKTS